MNEMKLKKGHWIWEDPVSHWKYVLDPNNRRITTGKTLDELCENYNKLMDGRDDSDAERTTNN